MLPISFFSYCLFWLFHSKCSLFNQKNKKWNKLQKYKIYNKIKKNKKLSASSIRNNFFIWCSLQSIFLRKQVFFNQKDWDSFYLVFFSLYFIQSTYIQVLSLGEQLNFHCQNKQQRKKHWENIDNRIHLICTVQSLLLAKLFDLLQKQIDVLLNKVVSSFAFRE